MIIRLLKAHRRNGQLHRRGTVLEAGEHTAAFLIRHGAAVAAAIPATKKNSTADKRQTPETK